MGNAGEPALDLSVVLPVYEERDSLPRVITHLVHVLRETRLSFEVIAVDDGSRDGTREVLETLAVEFKPYLRVILQPYNKGNGAAVKAGIQAAVGSTIACMDADGQHDPGDLRRMLPYIAEFDMVVGARTSGYGGAWSRRVANRSYNAIASRLARFPVEDLTSGFRVFRAAIVRRYLPLFPARFSYPTTTTLVFLKAGHNVKFVQVEVGPRLAGKSKISLLSDGWQFLVIILKIVTLMEPLRVFLPLAGLSFVLAVVSSCYSTWNVQRLHVPNSSVALFILSVLVLLLGIISEQISALQMSLRGDVDR